MIDLIEGVDLLLESASPEKQLVDNIMRRGFPHPLMRNTVTWGFKDDPKAMVMIELRAQADSVYITGLLSTVQKKGYGQYVMQLIVDEADRLGVTLVGTAEPFGTPEVRIPKGALIKFYKGFGFDIDSRGSMVRKLK